MAGNHAIIAPSSLALTVACQAHVQLARGLPPEPPTEDTQRGDAADWVAKQYARGNEVAYGSDIPLPGNFKVDYDMIHGAKLWTEVLGYGAVSGTPIVCSRIHPTDCWGEPDGWRYDPIAQRLRLPDYKYGFGVVDPFEWWQGIGYAAGILETLGLDDTQVTVDFIIVQPRAPHPQGPVRTWTVPAVKLRTYVNRAHHAAMLAWPSGMPEHPPLQPPQATTGVHCATCPARLVCRAFQHQTSQAVQYISRAEAVAMDATAVGVELAILEDMEELLQGRLLALRAQAEAMLRAGKSVPNYRMAPGQARMEWLPGVTPEEVDALGAVLGRSMRKPERDINSKNSSVVTPTQAINAGIDRAVISNYAARPNPAMKLERLTTTEARKAFGAFNA